MLWILVSNRMGRERFLHRGGPLEFGRGPQRDVPRKVLTDPSVSNNQLRLDEQADAVVGISGDVDLHELHAETASAGWQARCEPYERALELHEAGQWSEACQVLLPSPASDGGTFDLPGLTLLGRAAECLKAPPPRFDGVLELRSK
jgi:hypothetical protein